MELSFTLPVLILDSRYRQGGAAHPETVTDHRTDETLFHMTSTSPVATSTTLRVTVGQQIRGTCLSRSNDLIRAYDNNGPPTCHNVHSQAKGTVKSSGDAYHLRTTMYMLRRRGHPTSRRHALGRGRAPKFLPEPNCRDSGAISSPSDHLPTHTLVPPYSWRRDERGKRKAKVTFPGRRRSANGSSGTSRAPRWIQHP